jgi:hypothetical protein
VKAGGVVKSRQTEQVIGREAGTATFLSRCLFTFGLRVARSRPRQRRRYVASLIKRVSVI